MIKICECGDKHIIFFIFNFPQHCYFCLQGASAALAEARRNAAKAGNSFRRNRSSYNYSDRR